MAVLHQLMMFPAVGKPECLYALSQMSCVYEPEKPEYSASRTEFCGISGQKMYLKSHETGAFSRKPGPVGFVGCFVVNSRMS
jgi:hypothetical protein